MRPCVCDNPDCLQCRLYHKNPRYKALWDNLPIPEKRVGSQPGPGLIQQAVPMVGPGTELKKLLLELGITDSENCACNAKAMQMNRWGAEGCREHKAEIVAWLKEQQKDRGWGATLTAATKAITAGLLLNPLDPLGSLVDEAIKKADGKRKQEAIKRYRRRHGLPP